MLRFFFLCCPFRDRVLMLEGKLQGDRAKAEVSGGVEPAWWGPALPRSRPVP